jgi:hypothetical protein
MLYLDVTSNEYVRLDDSQLESAAKCLDAESWHALGALQLPEPAQSRLKSLAEMTNEGQLTTDEANEYDRFIELGDVITTLRLKAERQESGTRAK